MSTTAEINIAPLPTTEEVALTLAQWLLATTGVVTDFNVGSTIREYSEAIGSVCEIEGITSQSQALQAMIYSAYAAFGISPLVATPSVGTVTFSTLSGQPLPAGISVIIPINTVVQTTSSIQFTTTASAILVSGTTNISNVPIQSVVAASTSNINTGLINQLVTNLAYPLSVSNPNPTTGGALAETPSATLSRFLSYVNSLGRGTPLGIASAAIGVSYNGEIVQYSTCYENWIYQVSINQTPTPGFVLYIDNGSGSASSNLITTVYNYLSTGGIVGYRPAGVPYSVLAVNPVTSTVVVVAAAVNPSLDAALTIAIINAISVYYDSLNFGNSAELSQLTATISNVTIGQLTSLSITMLDSNGNPQAVIACGPTQRIILSPSPNVSVN